MLLLGFALTPMWCLFPSQIPENVFYLSTPLEKKRCSLKHSLILPKGPFLFWGHWKMTVFHKIVNGPEPKENCPALCFLSQGRRGICNIYIYFLNFAVNVWLCPKPLNPKTTLIWWVLTSSSSLSPSLWSAFVSYQVTLLMFSCFWLI